MFMFALRYMFITVLTNRPNNNSANMFHSNSANMFIMSLSTFLPEVRSACSPVTHPISSTVILPTCSQVPQ